MPTAETLPTSRSQGRFPPYAVCLLVFLAGCQLGDAAYKLDWVEGPPLPEPLAGHCVGTFRGELILAGGLTLRDGKPVAIDTVRKYDPNTGATGPLPPLPRPMAHAGCATAGDDFVIVGGADGDRALDEAFRLTLKDGKPVWERLPRLPGPRTAPSVAAVGRVVYLVGGAESGRPESASADDFQLDLDRLDVGWTPRSGLPGAPRQDAGTAVGGERIFLFGGRQRDGDGRWMAYADAYRWSRYLDDWVRLADLPDPAFGLSAAALDDRFLLLTGAAGPEHLPFKPVKRKPRRAEDEPPARPVREEIPEGPEPPDRPVPPYFGRSWVYDSHTDMYYEVEALPRPVNGPALVVRNGVLFAIGGYERPGGPVNATQQAVLTPRGYKWFRGERK